MALFAPVADAVAAIARLDDLLGHLGNRNGRAVRRRLEALARHPDLTVRCRAYQVLVMDDPAPDYQRYLPAFIESGQTFLDEESIHTITHVAIEPRRLQALRQRMHAVPDPVRRQTW